MPIPRPRERRPREMSPKRWAELVRRSGKQDLVSRLRTAGHDSAVPLAESAMDGAARHPLKISDGVYDAILASMGHEKRHPD